MKKCSIALVFVLASILLLCGCGRGKVGERQIKEDLNNKFSEQQFIVDSVKIDLAKYEKNMSLYDITVKMTTPNANVERMYRVLYNYYDVGGWVMDELLEINTGDWKAIPTKFDVSNEKIAEIIFTKDTHRNGFFINKKIIPNVKFNAWTQDTSGDRKAEEYIDWVSDYGIKDDSISIGVQCSAKCSKWEIAERFMLNWCFNKTTLKWEFVSGESIENDIEFFDGVEGIYWFNLAYNRKESIEIKVIDGEMILLDKSNEGYLIEKNIKEWQIQITGLFNGEIHRDDGIESIDFYTCEKMEIGINSRRYKKE